MKKIIKPSSNLISVDEVEVSNTVVGYKGNSTYVLMVKNNDTYWVKVHRNGIYYLGKSYGTLREAMSVEGMECYELSCKADFIEFIARPWIFRARGFNHDSPQERPILYNIYSLIKWLCLKQRTDEMLWLIECIEDEEVYEERRNNDGYSINIMFDFDSLHKVTDLFNNQHSIDWLKVSYEILAEDRDAWAELGFRAKDKLS